MLRDADLVSVQEARDLAEKAYEASQKFLAHSQEQVDAIIDAMAQAAIGAAEELARLAVEETGYGNVADKVEKNLFSSRDTYRAIRPMKTVGIVREDPEARVLEVSVPVGVVAAVLPTTNPTSTAICNVLITLKGRNAIVLSPHPNAIRCICHTADLLSRAARQAGAPENVIGCMRTPTLAGTQELMRRCGCREGRLHQRQARLWCRPGQRARVHRAQRRRSQSGGRYREWQVLRLRHHLLQRAGAGGRGAPRRRHPRRPPRAPTC